MADLITRTLRGPGTYMCGLTWDGSVLWHSDQEAATIYAVDPADGGVLRRFGCPWVRADLAYDGERLWQVGGRPKRIVLVDPATGEIGGQRQVLPADGRLTGAEVGPEGVWMCLRGPSVVQLRDRDSLSVLLEHPALCSAPSGLTYAGGVIVYGDFEEGVLYAMHPETGEHLGAARVPGRPTGLAWDGHRLWYCDFSARSFRALNRSAVLYGSAPAVF